MHTAVRQSAAPVRRHLSAAACLRHGYQGSQAAAAAIRKLCPQELDRPLSRKTAALEDAVVLGLREATQAVLAHPTLRTLQEAFAATDAVLKLTADVANRSRRLVDITLQVRIHVLVAGVREGIAELEAGLERIPLLAASAPDYPEDV